MESAESFLKRPRSPGEESLKPIELANAILNYANFSEETQCSVYMQKDIETRTQQMKLGNGLRYQCTIGPIRSQRRYKSYGFENTYKLKKLESLSQ